MEHHQGDFYMAGDQQVLEKLKVEMKKDLMLKFSGWLVAGRRWPHLKTTRIRTNDGIYIVANNRYVTEVLRSLGLESAKPVPTP